MPDRLLRHKMSGILYVYQDVYAARDDFEQVATEPEAESEAPMIVRRARSTLGLKAVPEVVQSVELTPQAALEADASRRTP